MDDSARRRHRLRNLLQSILLLGGMVGLLTLCAWVVFGAEGALWALGGWVLALILSPRVSPALVLRLYRARRLGPLDRLRQLTIGPGLAIGDGAQRPPDIMLKGRALGFSQDLIRLALGLPAVGEAA